MEKAIRKGSKTIAESHNATTLVWYVCVCVVSRRQAAERAAKAEFKAQTGTYACPVPCVPSSFSPLSFQPSLLPASLIPAPTREGTAHEPHAGCKADTPRLSSTELDAAMGGTHGLM